MSRLFEHLFYRTISGHSLQRISLSTRGGGGAWNGRDALYMPSAVSEPGMALGFSTAAGAQCPASPAPVVHTRGMKRTRADSRAGAHLRSGIVCIPGIDFTRKSKYYPVDSIVELRLTRAGKLLSKDAHNGRAPVSLVCDQRTSGCHRLLRHSASAAGEGAAPCCCHRLRRGPRKRRNPVAGPSPTFGAASVRHRNSSPQYTAYSSRASRTALRDA